MHKPSVDEQEEGGIQIFSKVDFFFIDRNNHVYRIQLFYFEWEYVQQILTPFAY